MFKPRRLARRPRQAIGATGRWLWRHRLLAACTVVVLAAGAFGVQRGVDRTRVLREDLAGARAGAAAELVPRILVEEQIRDTRARLATSAEDLQGELARIDEVNGAQEAIVVALAEGKQSVEATNEVLAVQAFRLETMRRCLRGVTTALAAVRSDQFLETVRALKGVEAECESALGRSDATAGYPLVDANFADPFMLVEGGQYYAYATNGYGGSIQLARGASLDSMELVGPALAQLPAWGRQGKTWAPTVLRRAGYWVMYYSLEHAQTGGTCISRAVAFSPAGPFSDSSTTPFLCQAGGSIDPSPFVDGAGMPWLTWKAEEMGGTTDAIYTQRLTPDGLALEGDSAELIHADQVWESGVVEGPDMVGIGGGRYVLLYSGGLWTTAGYGVGWATCEGPTGPCTKPSGRAVYSGENGVSGAGGQQTFLDAQSRLRVIFHGWAAGEVGYPNPRRAYIANLDVLASPPRINVG